MRMRGLVIMAALLVAVAQLPFGRSLPTTGPAFLWSPYLDGLPGKMKDIVDYRILSPSDLAKSVIEEGRWSNFLCPEEERSKAQNFAFLYVGRKLQSLDISRSSKADAALVDFLKDSFSNSNFSLAFPYVTASEEVAMEKYLTPEFVASCQQKTGINNVAVMESCFIEGDNFDRLKDIHSVQDYLNSRVRINLDGQSNLIVLCHEEGSDQPHSESSILSKILDYAEQLGVKYTFLYVSDPFRSIQYPSQRALNRFLAEGNLNNETIRSSTCDGVCQIKSSLLEGLLVAIVLLIILISGLCCMMGIDTPTRFETPQDS